MHQLCKGTFGFKFILLCQLNPYKPLVSVLWDIGKQRRPRFRRRIMRRLVGSLLFACSGLLKFDLKGKSTPDNP